MNSHGLFRIVLLFFISYIKKLFNLIIIFFIGDTMIGPASPLIMSNQFLLSVIITAFCDFLNSNDFFLNLFSNCLLGFNCSFDAFLFVDSIWPICRALFLFIFAKHDNVIHVIFPDHSPEMTLSLIHWTLSCNKSFLVSFFTCSNKISIYILLLLFSFIRNTLQLHNRMLEWKNSIISIKLSQFRAIIPQLFQEQLVLSESS